MRENYLYVILTALALYQTNQINWYDAGDQIFCESFTSLVTHSMFDNSESLASLATMILTSL